MPKDITTFWFRPCDRQTGLETLARFPLFTTREGARESCDACYKTGSVDAPCRLRSGRILAYDVREEE
jgi:hypothetical protein